MNRSTRVVVNSMNQFTRRVLFLLFFLSGFCSLAYQVVWTRMAFASFGIITPVLSVVLSVFMLGLAAGSWAGGRCIVSLVEKTGLSAVVFYAGAEFLIGLGAFAVPKLFAMGEHILLAAGQTNSIGYLSRRRPGNTTSQGNSGHDEPIATGACQQLTVLRVYVNFPTASSRLRSSPRCGTRRSTSSRTSPTATPCSSRSR